MSPIQKDKLQSRKEIVIPITLRGLWKGLEKICVEGPLNAVSFVARKSDDLAQRMMTGRLALVGMPAGLMLRNGARVTNSITNLKSGSGWGNVTASTFGVVGALGAWWIGGTALAATLGATAFGGTVGTIGSFIAAAVLSSPILLPAFGAAVMFGGLTVGAVCTALSIVPAVANIPVALNRTVDAWKGIKYDEAALKAAEEEFARNGSLTYDHNQRKYNKVLGDFYSLPASMQKDAYEHLKETFDAAAKPPVEAAPVAAPAAAPKQGGNKQEI